MNNSHRYLLILLVIMTFFGCGEKSQPTTLPAVRLKVTESAYAELKSKRDKAVKVGVLVSSEKDYVPVKMALAEAEFDGKMRLKGDWTDHLEDPNKWSFKLKMDGSAPPVLFPKFSLQHPKTRNYLYEWMGQELLQKEGLHTIHYDFVQLHLELDNGTAQDLGVYATEQAFGPQVAQHNDLPGKVILKLDEDRVWKDRFRAMKIDKENWGYYVNPDHQQVGRATVYAEKSLMADSTTKAQAFQAQHLLEGFATGKLKASTVFDIPQLAKFNALLNLIGAEHGVIWHNLRFYFDPQTQLLQPIAFDLDAGKHLEHLRKIIHTNDDLAFNKAYAQALDEVSKKDMVSEINKFCLELMSTPTAKAVTHAFPEAGYDSTMLQHNAKVIKKYLDEQNELYVKYVKHAKNAISLAISNESDLAVECKTLRVKGLKTEFSFPLENRYVLPGQTKRFEVDLGPEFNDHFENAFDIHKDYSDLKVRSAVYGLKKTAKSPVRLFVNQRK